MQLVRLSEVDPESLGPTFEQEIRCWRRHLFWDYRPAVDLIRKYMVVHRLPGYALKDGSGSLVGYSYYVVDRPVGYLGNVYIRRECASRDAYRLLIQRTSLAIKATPDVERIESQVFSFNWNLEEVFAEEQFLALSRRFLVLNLERRLPLSSPSPPLEIVGWTPHHFEQAAELIYDSYRRSPDRELCRDYQSPNGCSRFLRNVVDNPGCGLFSPATSLLALDRSGHPVAILLSSTISSDTGMIPQISVKTSHQGKGIGRWLLLNYFEKAARSGLRRVTLSVTQGNKRAYDLYMHLGFELSREFFAYIWNRPALD